MGKGGGLIDRLAKKRELRRWAALARRADAAEPSELRRHEIGARALRQQLDQVIHVAESRLTLPRMGSNAIRRPVGTDWAWRPQVWRGPLAEPGRSSVENKDRFGDGLTLFHDCRISEMTLRQRRNAREEDLAPFGLQLDVFRFDGSFLSLVVDMPPESCAGLRKRHLIRVDAIIDMEKPLEMFARLNVRHGPNTEQIVRELPLSQREVLVEFDLAYTKLNEKRVEQMWLDLIFDGPEMNQVSIRDLTFCRYPRAEL